MKNKIFLLFFCIFILNFFAGCNNEQDIDNIKDISTEEKFNQEISNLIENYFIAIKEHSYQQMTEYTNENYIMNYNQTYFEDFTRYITDYTVDEIVLDDLKNNNGTYTVSVKYTLFYSDNYITEENSIGGNCLYYDDFTIIKNDENYIIFDVRHKGVG